MITTTRCPSCKTRFRVSEEQLKLADGWVRCGHCADIFDATLSLRRQETEGDSTDETGFEPSRIDTVIGDDSRWGDAAADPQRIKRRQPKLDEPSGLGLLPDTDVAPLPEATAAPSASAAEPEFVRQARRRAFWHRPATRAALGVLSVALVALLLGQWALHQRDRLVATDPSLQPHLARACAWLGCELRPWRQIEALRIDSATLLRKKGDDYQLDLVLRNQARQPVAVPALELSLTNSREQVIVRRVLTPAELVAEATVPGNGQLSLSVPLQVKLGADQAMAGYNTFIFYP
jgi:predicted Zn finger-like uncharacterized protein